MIKKKKRILLLTIKKQKDNGMATSKEMQIKESVDSFYFGKKQYSAVNPETNEVFFKVPASSKRNNDESSQIAEFLLECLKNQGKDNKDNNDKKKVGRPPKK